MDENENIPYQIDFPLGKIVSGRWKVASKIGTGAYGVVYCVSDEKKPPNLAALKVELNEVENSVLKIEREVLDRLQDRKHTIRLFGSGKRADYSYIVITLCGADLSKLKQEKKITKFTESTTYRIAIHALYAIKQLHEVGYVHRDVKPQNFVIGDSEKDSRIVYLIDFGMVRKYAVPDEQLDEHGKPIKSPGPKKWIIRKARKKILLRGTMRYCSLNVHKRNEQGRSDDIISLIYMLAEMRFSLPWSAAQREERLIALKEGFPTDPNLNKCEGMRDILQYLSNVKYSERPDYKFIYNCLMDVIKKRKWKFSEPYDWEEQPPPSPLPTTTKKAADDSKKKEAKKVAVAAVVPQVPTITVSGEHLIPPASSSGDGTSTTTDSNFSTKSNGISKNNQAADSREFRTRSPSRSIYQEALEETTAKESSFKNAKEPASDKSKTKILKEPSEKSKSRNVKDAKDSSEKNAKTAYKDVKEPSSDKSKSKNMKDAAKDSSVKSKYPVKEPSEKKPPATIKEPASERKKKGSKRMKEIVGVKENNKPEEEMYPTTAPTAFDFKPGDVPSGTSLQAKEMESINPNNNNKLQNSARSDIKNLKSVMSLYTPL